IHTFLNFPYAKTIGYFSLNKETFLFEYQQSSNSNDDAFFINIIDILIESGKIGLSINNRIITYFEDDTKEYKLFIIPIFSPNSIIGLIIIKTDFDIPDIEIITLNLSSMLSAFVGNFIENLVINDENTRTKDLLEQIVATRTIDIQRQSLMISEKLENLKQNLIMTIPHEVRTPINAILGFSDYLINYSPSTQTSEWDDIIDILIDIKKSANRLKRFFENYIYYAQLVLISSNINEIKNIQNKKTYTVEPIIYDIALNAAQKYFRKDDVIVNIVDSAIIVSEEYFTKVIEELVDNAFKFSDTGSKVEISSHIDNNIYVLSIKDYGRGMSNEEIDGIDTYIQFDRNIYEQQGSGLGLSIVRRIIDLYNANFNVKSVKDSFTEVIIEFQITKLDFPM
ncbi:MAG TPA: sensor histidine kinase, partial [Candidatus Kapabacteria bacterium]|nr:sensor histidine kinase [Candidatus Kapabacteria bacterium]